MNNNPPSELLRRLLEASANSPLAEADPNSLDELMSRIPAIFNTKPLELTDSDITDQILYYRSKRSMVAQLAKERADKEPAKRKKSTANLPEVGI